jgi:hypothetical protein
VTAVSRLDRDPRAYTQSREFHARMRKAVRLAERDDTDGQVRFIAACREYDERKRPDYVRDRAP